MLFTAKKEKTKNINNPDKVTTGKLRLTTDLNEYSEDVIKGVNIFYDDPTNIMAMKVSVEPEKQSLYSGAVYTFLLNFPTTYPIDPPTLTIKDRVLHPQFSNLNVCLPLVRADWKPTLSLYNIICGLLFLFNSPNPKDPLDPEAAMLMNDNLEEFKKTLYSCLRGGSYKGIKYDRMIK